MKPISKYLSIAIIILSCSQNNVSQDDSLKKYFDENKVEGCFALMNNATGKFTIYNLSRYRDSSYLPASTFHILGTLIGLQTGKIVNDSMIIPWDGVIREHKEWNKNLTMYQAFRVCALPYYQEVARRIGKKDMECWIDSLKYGAKEMNEKVTVKTAIDSFWIDNSLKITPDQQLGLIKKLYFNQLPFFRIYQETVKRAMLVEDNSNYRLGYTTGMGTSETNNTLGWITGWIEENNHPYFFVLNIESTDPNKDVTQVCLRMLRDILKQIGFFNGTM